MILNKKRQRLLIGLVGVWFIAIMAGLWWLLQARLTWFDAEERLQQQASSQDFEVRLEQLLKPASQSFSGAVFHIVDEDCRCNWRSQGHQASIQRQVKAAGGKNYWVSLQDYPQLAQMVPAAPAVIIYSKDAKLLYIGPYADGAFCSSSSSFVETLIPKVVTPRQPTQLGGWVNTLAKGCYCPT